MGSEVVVGTGAEAGLAVSQSVLGLFAILLVALLSASPTSNAVVHPDMQMNSVSNKYWRFITFTYFNASTL